MDSEIQYQVYYDYDAGILRWMHTTKKHIANTEAGYINEDGYKRVGIDNKTYLVHRVIWFLEYGYWPTDQIDHINCVRDDNRLVNLRDVTPKINANNRLKNKLLVPS